MRLAGHQQGIMFWSTATKTPYNSWWVAWVSIPALED